MERPNNPSSPWGQPSTQASRDWAQRGHADSTALTSVVRSQRHPSAMAPAAAPRFSRQLRRTAGTVVLAVLALGSAGSALALRDALFPAVGDDTTRSVWANPGQTDEPPASSTPPASALAPATTTTVAEAPPTSAAVALDGSEVASPSGTIANDERSVTAPGGTAPSGTSPDGTAPSGTDPSVTAPSGSDDDDADDSSGSGKGRSGDSGDEPDEPEEPEDLEDPDGPDD